MRFKILVLAVVSLNITCSPIDESDWQGGPVQKYEGNPIITPQGDSWEATRNSVSQSGIVEGRGIVPIEINGRYWMYFGDINIWAVWSEDLINWTMIKEPVMEPREDKFDSRLIEPGPTPLTTEDGILLLYNSTDQDLVYRTGQALFDVKDPTKSLKQSDEPFLGSSTELEVGRQISNVVFIQKLAKLHDTWFYITVWAIRDWSGGL